MSKSTFGWRLAEFGDGARQKIERQRLAAGDAHGAAAQALQVLDLRLHALGVAALLAQIIDEYFAGGSKPHAARQAFEQRRAEFLFEIGDAAVDRGGGDIELFGGLADRAGARDGIDIIQNSQDVSWAFQAAGPRE